MTDKAPSNMAIRPIQATNLYRQEIYADPDAGSIIVQFPVNAMGIEDSLRIPLFGGQIMAQTNRGPMPLQFQIPNVTTLEEAVEAWPAAVVAAVREMQNQQVRNQILQGVGGRIDTSQVRTKN